MTNPPKKSWQGSDPPPPSWQCQDFHGFCYGHPSLMSMIHDNDLGSVNLIFRLNVFKATPMTSSTSKHWVENSQLNEKMRGVTLCSHIITFWTFSLTWSPFQGCSRPAPQPSDLFRGRPVSSTCCRGCLWSSNSTGPSSSAFLSCIWFFSLTIIQTKQKKFLSQIILIL